MAGAEGVAAKTDRIQLANPKTYAITGWGRMNDAERLKVIRSVALRRGRDPGFPDRLPYGFLDPLLYGRGCLHPLHNLLGPPGGPSKCGRPEKKYHKWSLIHEFLFRIGG